MFYIHVNDACKRLTFNINCINSLLKEGTTVHNVFLIKDRLKCFYLNIRFSDSKSGRFIFTFPKKLGRSGDGKPNILFGCPNVKNGDWRKQQLGPVWWCLPNFGNNPYLNFAKKIIISLK